MDQRRHTMAYCHTCRKATEGTRDRRTGEWRCSECAPDDEPDTPTAVCVSCGDRILEGDGVTTADGPMCDACREEFRAVEAGAFPEAGARPQADRRRAGLADLRDELTAVVHAFLYDHFADLGLHGAVEVTDLDHAEDGVAEVKFRVRGTI